MKATILVRDLVKLIAKHGDLDVNICANIKTYEEVCINLKCVDEAYTEGYESVESFELYGEEK